MGVVQQFAWGVLLVGVVRAMPRGHRHAFIYLYFCPLLGCGVVFGAVAYAPPLPIPDTPLWGC